MSTRGTAMRLGVVVAWSGIGAMLAVAPARADAQQSTLRAEWSRNATEYRGQNGRRVTVLCPPQGQVAEVWGTDEYTDDSPICSAAAHAGAITPESGGAVTIVISRGRSGYAGSSRNGVTSKSFSQFNGSYTIAPPSEIGRIDWRTAAQGVNPQDVQSLTLECPPNGLPSQVWGTDVYSDDSSICTAAVHAGLITTTNGGRVTIQPAGAQLTFTGSTRNGVATRDFAEWPNAFRFASAAASAPAPATTTVASAPAATTTTVASAPVATTTITSAPTRATTTTLTTATTTATTTAVASAMPTAATTTMTRPTTVSGSGTVASPLGTTGAVLAGTPPPSARGETMVGSLPAMVAPTNVRVQPLYYRGTVMVSWDTMPGATGYQIVGRPANGVYTSAMPTGLTEYGPERTQGITREIPFDVPIIFAVVANYPQGSSPPSAPVTVSLPRWYGTYRVSILGFTVDRETKDDPLETDGKRDEVYLRAAAAERGPDGNQYGGVTQLQTLVHGDINTTEWRSGPRRRIKAGTASVDGGLKTGDGFPTAQPWLQSTASTSTNSFPLKVWQGNLVQGYNSVQVAFNLWESDQRPGQDVPSYASFSPEATALARAAPATARLEPTLAGKVLAGAVAGVVLAPVLVPVLALSAPALVPTVAAAMMIGQITPQLPVIPKVSTPFDGLYDAVGLTAAQMALDNGLDGAKNAVLMGASNYVNDWASNLSLAFNAQDHPIGVRKDAQGRLYAPPSMLTLSFENAESDALRGNGPVGKGPGIYAYTLTDQASDPGTGMGGNGIYTVYVRVERVQ